jgi:epoxyqueuosine reductase
MMAPLPTELAGFLEDAGVAQWGVAACPAEPWPYAPPLPRAVSIGIALTPAIIGVVEHGPTATYFAEYKRVNAALADAVQGLAALLRAQGATAEPLQPTVGYKSGRDMTAAGLFAHKTAATQAGLGWIGKTAIFVSPRLGPWVRLATVFTDAELPAAEPVTEGCCAGCRRCVDACPAGAGRDVRWRAGMPRDELLDVVACLRETESNNGAAGGLCGVCLAVCPFGRRLLRDRGTAALG